MPETHYHLKFADHKPEQDGYQYEMEIYNRGLDFERPALTFQADKWEELACSRLSSEAKGYVYGSAGTRETTDKNRAAFKKWSIVPRRLVKTETFPDLSTEVLGEKLQFPIAMAPVGVLKIFNPSGEIVSPPPWTTPPIHTSKHPFRSRHSTLVGGQAQRNRE